MKQIAVVDIRGESVRDARIEPGTTPDDLRRALSLPEGYQFSSQPGAEPLRSDANLYLAVPDGAKLYAGTEVNVGTEDHDDGDDAFFGSHRPLFTPRSKATTDWITQFFATKSRSPVEIPITIAAPVITAPTMRPPIHVGANRSLRRVGTAPILVQRHARPVWQERGWRLSGDTYLGEFRTPHGRWQGKARKRVHELELFIKDPPEDLEHHSHAPCFREREDGWHFVHVSGGLTDLSAGIVAVERILREVYVS